MAKKIETFEPITFVTMCFNLGGVIQLFKDDGQRRNYQDFYIKSLKGLCGCADNLVVFCDDECAQMLNDINDANIELVVLALEELELWKEIANYRGIFKRMAKKIEWRQRIPSFFPEVIKNGCIVKPGLEYENAVYTVLNQTKPNLIKKAMKKNPFKTGYFYWIDAGMMNHAGFFFSYDYTLRYKPKAVRMAVNISDREKSIPYIIRNAMISGSKPHSFI